MILVSKSPGEPKGAMGIVTLEGESVCSSIRLPRAEPPPPAADVIEEVIGEEIIDETDVFVDVHNKIKVVRNRPQQGTSANYAGLVQGIIERRRKSGMMKRSTPLKSYGALGTSVGATGGKASDKVAIKRPGSPMSTTASQASYSTDGGMRGWGSPRNANGPASGGVVLPGGAVIPSRRMSNEPERKDGGSGKTFPRTQTWSHPDASSSNLTVAPGSVSDASESSTSTLVPPPPAPASVTQSPRAVHAQLGEAPPPGAAAAAAAASLPLLDEAIAEQPDAEAQAAGAAAAEAKKQQQQHPILDNARRVFGDEELDERTTLLGNEAKGKGN
jgi:hypothetical protein